MNKRKISMVVLAVLAIVLVGGTLTVQAQSGGLTAGMFQNFLNFFKTNPSTTQTAATPTPSASSTASLYKPAVDYENAVISAVKKASPSVVSIVITKELPVIEQCPYNPFGGQNGQSPFGSFFGNGQSPFQFYQPCQTGTQTQEVGGGTGFFVSSDGMIVTNKHVVADTSAQYTVLTNDGKKHAATVLARDPVQDLAILKIDGTGYTPADLGDSDSAELGQTAIAIGNALGEFRNTVSVGVVSGLARSITAQSGQGQSEQLSGLIQTDAAINEGNSGGPLLNLKGQVIGIDTAIAANAQNIGFAIPVNQVKNDIASVKSSGKISTPFLGVRYLMVDSSLQKSDNLSVDYGALLRGDSSGPAVVPGSPAANADLRAEDIILDVNGTKVNSDHDLATLIQRYKVGDTVKLTVLRSGAQLTITVVLGSQPQSSS